MDVATGLKTMQLTSCPECGQVAEITRRAVLESTDGPIEHAAVRCAAGHTLMLPTADLERVSHSTPPAASPVHPRR